MTGEGFDENRGARPNNHPYQSFVFPLAGEFRDTATRYSGAVTLRGLARSLYDVQNGLDQAVQVTIEVDHKKTFPKPYVAKTFSLGAGLRQMETLSDPWGFVRIKIVPAVAPTAGALVTEFEGADY